MSAVAVIHGRPETFDLEPDELAGLIEQARAYRRLVRITDRLGESVYIDPWAVSVIRAGRPAPARAERRGRLFSVVEPDKPESGLLRGSQGVCAEHGPFDFECPNCLTLGVKGNVAGSYGGSD